MRDSQSLSEADLERLERRCDPDSVPHLVSVIRQQQHELDSLRLSVDVARRDREELRSALLAAHAEIQRLRDPDADAPLPQDRGES
jgi:hypothetical protein